MILLLVVLMVVASRLLASPPKCTYTYGTAEIPRDGDEDDGERKGDSE